MSVQSLEEELLKQYRQQQEKETYQTKINFFTQVAHEIRTPLSLIKMPLESIIQLSKIALAKSIYHKKLKVWDILRGISWMQKYN